VHEPSGSLFLFGNSRIAVVSSNFRAILTHLQCASVKGNRCLIEKKGENTATSDGNNSIASGIVLLDGAMINIDNVVNNLNKSEKTRLEMEAKLKATEEKYGTLILVGRF
jgi:hypothetical protein